MAERHYIGRKLIGLEILLLLRCLIICPNYIFRRLTVAHRELTVLDIKAGQMISVENQGNRLFIRLQASDEFSKELIALIELIEEILNEQADALVQTSSREVNIYESILKGMEFAMQNKTAMLHLYNSVNKDVFERYLNRVANYTVTECFNIYFSEENLYEEDKQAIIMYYKSLLVGFVIEWLSSGMKYDLRNQVRRQCELFEGTTETAVKRCRRKEN